MIIIKVFEYSRLSVGEGGFAQTHFELLVRYNEQHGNKYFNVGIGRIYFKNYVGVIQVGRLIIEILPKADKGEIDTKTELTKWHNALIYMLHFCGYINIESISRADLKLQRITLIDLFYKVFLEEVWGIIHFGLIRRYRYKSDNLPFLKGRLVFNRHIAENYLHKEMFYTTHQVYDQNNVYNQIIFQALLALKNINKNGSFSCEVNELLNYFEELDYIKISDDLFDSILYNRNSIKYKNAINFSRMILQNYSPDLNSGNNSIIGILFDMNVLFEKVVFKLLMNSENLFSQNGLSLSAQTRKKFWQDKTIRPDIIGEYRDSEGGSKKRFVIDTKWKIPSNNLPDDADLKQMFSYNIHFGSDKSVLLYPWVMGCKKENALFNESVSVKEEFSAHTCSTYFIDLFTDDGHLNKDVGKDLIKSLIEDTHELAE